MSMRVSIVAALMIAGFGVARSAEVVLDRGPGSGPIWTLAVSPEGTTVATAGHDDGSVRLWDAADGTLKATLEGHKAAVHGLAFSPDGKTLATGSRDRTVKLWTVPEGRPLRDLSGSVEMIDGLAFFPDGATIAAGGGETGQSGVVTIWDVASGDVQGTFNGHADRVLGLAIARDGRTLASSSVDRSVRIWDVPSGRTIATLKGHDNAISVVALAPDGKTLASADWNGQLRLWNTADWKERARLSNLGDVRSLGYSPDGRMLALGTVHGLVKFLDPSTLRESGRALKHTREVFGLAYLPDGRALVSAGLDGTVKRWPAPGPPAVVTIAAESAPGSSPGSAGNNDPLKFVPVALSDSQRPTSVWSLALSRDGRRMAAGHGDVVRVWDLAARRELSHAALPGKNVRRVDLTPDGTLLAAAEYQQTPGGMVGNVITIRDAETCQVRQTLKGGHDSGINCVAFSPDGKTLASTGWGEKDVKLWDVATGAPKPSLAGHASQVVSAFYSADGKYLLSASLDKTALLWDVATGQARLVLKGHDEALETAVFSPDGSTLATCSYDKTIKLWSASDGRLLATLIGHANPVVGLAFHPDGKRLASSSSLWGQGHYGSSPAEIKFWDVETHAEVATLPQQPSHVFALAFTPDGKTFITGGRDSTVRLWDVETRKQTATLDPSRPPDQPEGEPAPVPLAVAYSPDGRFFATAGEDRLIVVRDAQSRQTLQTLAGHDDVIAGLAFSPDGSTLASSSYDRTVRLWEMPSGRPRGTLKGHRNWAFAVVFSPDGKTLASAGYDKTVRLWDVATGAAVGVLEGHTAGVRALAFSPDGQTLASASGDRTVRLWKVESRQVIHVMKGHKGAVRGVAFASDGQTLASAGEDRTIRLWNPVEGTLRTSAEAHADMVTCLAFSPGRPLLASGGWDGALRIWDIAGGQVSVTNRAHNDAISALAFGPGGLRLVTAGHDRAVKLWEAPRQVLAPWRTMIDLNAEVGLVAISPDGSTMIHGGKAGTLLINQPPNGSSPGRPLPIDAREAWAVAFAPDGQSFAVAEQNTVQLYETGSLRPVRDFQGHTAMIRALAFSPDGKTLASGSVDRHVKLWDVATGHELTSPPAQPLMISGVAFLPDGKTLAVATGDWTDEKKPGALTLWNVADAALKGSLTDFQYGINALAISRDGRLIATGGGDWLRLVDASTLAPRGRLKHDAEPSVHALAFLPDGKSLAAGSFQGDIVIWDLAGSRPSALLKGHTAKVNALAPSPDGRWLASGSLDRTLKLWRLAPPRRLAARESIATGRSKVWSLACSPDGKTLAMADGDFESPGLITLWDAATGKPRGELSGHEKGVASAVFAPDGQTLASGSWDGTIRIWDVAKGAERSRQEGQGVTRLAFAPDGKTLASAGEDRALKLWDVATGTPRAEVQGGSDRLQCLAFSPDGRFLATGGGPFDDKAQSYGEVRLWTVGSALTEVGRFDGHARSVVSIQFTPDGKTLVTGSADRTLRVWDVATRQTRLVVEGANAYVEALAISPDGRWLVSTSSANGGLILRELAGGEERAQLSGHSKMLRGLTFAPDGKTLATAADDGTLKLWNLPGS